MQKTTRPSTSRYLAEYMRRVLEARSAGAEPIDGRAPAVRGAGHIGPAFWADAPWRLEPGQPDIPLTLIVRDGQGPNAAVELDEIDIYEAEDDDLPWDEKDWHFVERYTDGLGRIDLRYWAYRPLAGNPPGLPPAIPIGRFATATLGRRLLLRVGFEGTRLVPHNGRQRFQHLQPLAIWLAEAALPWRDSPQWYYGDTHVHTSYTNDIKEFGNPVPDSRLAAERMGLDWLVVTDHSVDLSDENPYWEDPRADGRWAQLGQEVAAYSDDRLRLLRGEEVTLRGAPGRGDDTLHMLVLGHAFEKLIPGAWATQGMLWRIARLLPGFAPELYAHLFGPVHPLEAVLTGVDRTGRPVPALKGRSVQEQEALAFAAHPRSMAQAPGGTWEFSDLTQPLHGMQAWNGRMRHYARQQETPFDHWQPAGDWAESTDWAGIEAWDQLLRFKAGQADPRFVLLGGSDAHGSFNYSEGWWPDWDGFRADDNALGRVRTLLYLPHRAPASQRRAPTVAEAVSALGAGSCVLTDGPVLNLRLAWQGTQAALGEILFAGGGTVDVEVQAASTAEFGPVHSVAVHYYVRGMEGTATMTVPFAPGHTQILAEGLPTGPGYVRLTVETRAGSETYRCFTNPVWIHPREAGHWQLRVLCGGG